MTPTSLHIMVTGNTATVWSSIYETGEVIFRGSFEILNWIKLNSLTPLEHSKSYFPSIAKDKDHRPHEGEHEYLLSETETALFYLRFKP